jgi:hypothetical protein
MERKREKKLSCASVFFLVVVHTISAYIVHIQCCDAHARIVFFYSFRCLSKSCLHDRDKGWYDGFQIPAQCI